VAFVPRSLLLEELTSPEAGDAVASGYDTVVVGSGAVEQHGPHLAMVSDTLQGRAIALRLAERLGGTLVAPLIPVGCSSHHLGFAGTLSVRPETLIETYVDYCRALASHGFRRIACFASHGGNFAPLAAALPRLREAALPAAVAAYVDLAGLARAWRDTVEAFGEDPGKVGTHADIAETSTVLSLNPALVRADRIEKGYVGDYERMRPVLFRDGMKAVSANGVFGDPTGMSAELGVRCLASVVDLLAGFFSEEAAWLPD
jgi:creatinine amidohydrolase